MSEVIQHRGGEIYPLENGKFAGRVGTRSRTFDTLRKCKRWVFCEVNRQKDASRGLPS